MRLAFLGTPEAAVPVLEALVRSGHHVELVVTRPDRRRGRGAALSPSPVKRAALTMGLRVTHRLGDLDEVDVDRGVVVAFGVIIPASVLARVPMLNVHFSLLPRWRGAAPVERAILAGDEETGVSIMTLEASLDTGPVHAERRVAVDDKTAAALTAELAHLGADALLEVLATPALLDHPRPQVGEATYAEKISASTLRLDPTVSATQLLRVVRLGGAYMHVGGRRLAVVAASLAPASPAPDAGVLLVEGGALLAGAVDGALRLDEVRPESGRTMTGAAWWAGRRGADREITWS
jgi:methionyl-tRNA formyltransferase